ncbi:MAG: acyl-CoA reductase [Flavobacteriales bacterium]
MEVNQKINAFVSLGQFLGQFSYKNPEYNKNIKNNDLFFENFKLQLQLATAQNAWFTTKNLQFTCKSWSLALTKKNLMQWLSNYSFLEKDPKTVGLIMAGNIPLVGFHDFLSVLISGNKALIKLSSNDEILLPALAKYLIAFEPGFEELIEFTKDKIKKIDAVIATGSNNTARYFEYYFGNYPHIIRKNRNSIAVLSGTETNEQLKNLANDIFWYFGLGCRSVSKIYIPENYDFSAFFEAMFSWKLVLNNTKYINNYDYNKAVYLMSPEIYKNNTLLDNEFLLLKEDTGFSSPIAVLFYEKYKSLDELKKLLNLEKSNLQCIVSQTGINNEIDFGTTQQPQLWDYADHVDTLEFLLTIK